MNLENHHGFREISEKDFNLEKAKEMLKKEWQEHPAHKGEFEHKLGQLLFSELETVYLKYPDQIPENEIAKIRGIYHFYGELLGKDEMRMVKNGFLAEFAVAYSIYKNAGFPVYRPTQQEDLYGKIDLWVHLDTFEGKNIVPVQVKCMVGIKDPVIINTHQQKESDGFKEQYKDRRVVKDWIKFGEEIERINKYSGQFENVAEPILIILPSPESGDAVFNSITGRPDPRLGKVLYEKITKEEVLV